MLNPTISYHEGIVCPEKDILRCGLYRKLVEGRKECDKERGMILSHFSSFFRGLLPFCGESDRQRQYGRVHGYKRVEEKGEEESLKIVFKAAIYGRCEGGGGGGHTRLAR